MAGCTLFTPSTSTPRGLALPDCSCPTANCGDRRLMPVRRGGAPDCRFNRKGIDILFSYFNSTDRPVFMSGVLARDPQGNLYGTAAFEGDQGTIYELAADGTRSVLHYFEGTDG